MWSGLGSRGCLEARAPLNSPASPSDFCREPKYVLVFYTNHLEIAFEYAIVLTENKS